MLTSHDQVVQLLSKLRAEFRFEVKVEFKPRSGHAIRVLPLNEGAPEVIVFAVDGQVESIQTGVDLYRDIDVDPEGEWLRWLADLLEAIMARGFFEQVWRFKSGRHAGSRATLETRRGVQRFSGNLSFWPFSSLLTSETVEFLPFDREQSLGRT